MESVKMSNNYTETNLKLIKRIETLEQELKKLKQGSGLYNNNLTMVYKIIETDLTTDNFEKLADLIMDDRFDEAPLQAQISTLKLMVSALLYAYNYQKIGKG